MYNLNGQLTNTLDLSPDNRAFYYGDALFDTLKYKNNKYHFLELHYLRLLAGMRQLRMEIPSHFTLEFWNEELLKLIDQSPTADLRYRTTVWRSAKGLYTPSGNDINYLIETSVLNDQVKPTYSLGVYKNLSINADAFSHIKTTNRLPNVLASIYAGEHELDNVLLLNQHKNIACSTNANVFIVNQQSIYTPPISDGCLKGTIREVLLTQIPKHPSYSIEEKSLSITDIISADEVFLTNAITGIQPVTNFKRKTYSTSVAKALTELLQTLIV